MEEKNSMYGIMKDKIRSLPPLRILHIREKKFESIAQGPHVRIGVFLQLESLRDDFDGPVLQLRMLAGLETQEEIPRVFGVDAEGIHGAFRVGFRVGRKPALC